MDLVTGTRELDEVPRFEILGPLRAWLRDREVPLGPGKQRAVLAVLLVNANRPVSTSRLVDAVWADEPPRNGANVVQKYVAGLRRSLEPERSPRTPGKLLTLTDAGYLLRVPPGHLDLDLFHERVRQARSARTDGRPLAAAATLRQALALWRGEVLSGLTGTLFDTTRDRLEETRAAALEEWADLELDLGHHSQLLPELVRLVAEFPLREELRCLLMLALYRSGRQAEALAAYREARSFLNDEFGIEPGERLQELQQRILRADPTLTGTASAVTTPTGTTPVPGPPVPAPTPAPVPPPGPGSGPAPTAVAPAPAAVATPGRWGVWVARAVGLLLPLASFGLLTWAVIAYLAGRRGSWPLGVAAAGYFGLVAVFFTVALTSPETETLTFSVADAAGMLSLLLAWIGGTVHVAVLDPGRNS